MVIVPDLRLGRVSTKNWEKKKQKLLANRKGVWDSKFNHGRTDGKTRGDTNPHKGDAESHKGRKREVQLTAVNRPSASLLGFNARAERENIT